MRTSQNNMGSGLTGLVAGTGVCLAALSVTLPASAGIKPHDSPIAANTVRAPGCDHTYNYSTWLTSVS